MEPHPNNEVLTQLSDIKASLAVNTSETKNIKDTISEIRIDVREIKTQFITRKEYTDAHDELKSDVSFLRKIIWGTITTLITIGLVILRNFKI